MSARSGLWWRALRDEGVSVELSVVASEVFSSSRGIMENPTEAVLSAGLARKRSRGSA